MILIIQMYELRLLLPVQFSYTMNGEVFVKNPV